MSTLLEALQNLEYQKLYARYLVIKWQPISDQLVRQFDLRTIAAIEKEMRNFEKRRK